MARAGTPPSPTLPEARAALGLSELARRTAARAGILLRPDGCAIGR